MYARNPAEAYRQVAFDAHVAGADARQLVSLCFDRLDEALGRALLAAERGDNQAKSQALTRAVAALTALQLGVNGDATAAPALLQFYEGSRRRLLDCALSFDPARVRTIRVDLADVGAALRAG